MNVCCVSHVFSASSQHGFLTRVHSHLRQVRPLCEVPGWGPCSVTLGSKVPQYPLGVSAGPTAPDPHRLCPSAHTHVHMQTQACTPRGPQGQDVCPSHVRTPSAHRCAPACPWRLGSCAQRPSCPLPLAGWRVLAPPGLAHWSPSKPVLYSWDQASFCQVIGSLSSEKGLEEVISK